MKLSATMVNTRTRTGKKQYNMGQICRMPIIRDGDLKSHMRNNTADELYKCKFCGKSVTTASVLVVHMRSHTGERPYRCHICEKPFTQLYNLKRHTRTHTGEKPYKCQLCQKSFAYSSELTVHTRTHTGEKPYKCQLCKKAFARGGDLNIHIKYHTGERSYKCQLCQKAFVTGNQLKRHVSTHTSEKSHECQKCQKQFTLPRNLQLHMRIHLGEKPYICELCNKRFMRSEHLTRHRRTHSTKKQNTHSKNYTGSSRSSKKQFRRNTRTQQDLQMGTEVITDVSNHFITGCSTGVISKPSEPSRKKIYADSSVVTDCLATTKDGEFHVDAKVSASKSFGCGICAELFETEKAFLEHCSSHQFSPPDDLAADLIRIVTP